MRTWLSMGRPGDLRPEDMLQRICCFPVFHPLLFSMGRTVRTCCPWGREHMCCPWGRPDCWRECPWVGRVICPGVGEGSLFVHGGEIRMFCPWVLIILITYYYYCYYLISLMSEILATRKVRKLDHSQIFSYLVGS